MGRGDGTEQPYSPPRGYQQRLESVKDALPDWTLPFYFTSIEDLEYNDAIDFRKPGGVYASIDEALDNTPEQAKEDLYQLYISHTEQLSNQIQDALQSPEDYSAHERELLAKGLGRLHDAFSYLGRSYINQAANASASGRS